ncbi:MAG: phosphoglucosamine mutase [Candidatus Thorarchaeota archaeon]|nr:MAG: phosphoglucosamine mutase [Candidatus Thorarchaeota archaeon]
MFGTSGIRGSIAEKVTTDLALDLGRALGTTLNGKGCVGVGTDARTSHNMLESAFIAGVVSTGVDVINLRHAPMPAVAAHSAMPGVSASVIITASHNPPEDNGFKFFNGGREFIRSEEVRIEERVFDKEFSIASWKEIGTVSSWNIRESYLKQVKNFVVNRGTNGAGMRVLLDLANGAATDYTPHLLHDMGFEVSTINSHPDGYFPGRPAEPSPRNLVDTMKIVSDSDFSVALCHDGDGDRLAVIDEEGRFIDQNRVIALFAKDEVERAGEGTVVVSIDTSSVIDEVVATAGGSVVRAPLGSLQELLATDESNAIVFASEPWKPIFTKLGGWMDGIAGAARFAQMTNEIGSGSCSKLMASIPEYPMLRDHIVCPDELKTCFITTIKTKLVDEITGIRNVIDSDGVRIERDDGSYVLVRVSGTEPKARVYIGARSESTLQNLESTAKRLMQETLEDCESRK